MLALLAALALFMARIIANNKDHALAADNFALHTAFFYGCTDLHMKIKNSNHCRDINAPEGYTALVEFIRICK